MTSKEALDKLCKVKIYQKEASAYDYLGKEIYKEEINLIKQDLERLEVLETSVLEYKDKDNLFWETAQNNVSLRQENEKLEKALDEACKRLDCENRCTPDIDYSECWKKYFLKKVLGDV